VSRRRTKTALAAALALGAAFFGARHLRADKLAPAPARAHAAEARPQGPESAPQTTRARAPEARADGREKSPFHEPARSLRGTDVDGALRVGPDGELLLGPEILRLFDYFLTAEGEETDEVIRARILAAIRERADGPAALQAAALLDEYLSYRKDAKSIALPPERASDPEARLEAIRALRKKHFGEEAADAIFGDEEREGAAAMAESRVAKNGALSPEEREAKLAAIEDELPDHVRHARAESLLPVRARAEESAMREEGATDEAVRAHRVETFGEEAAGRLEELDQQRAAFKQRVEAFRKERSALARSAKDDEALRAAETALLERSFTETERLRVRAMLATPSP
jgi:lipase chaperone LimK